MDAELNYIPKSKYIYYKKKIGKGSFSKVYKGMNKETNQIVAIKIISLDLPNNLQKRLKMEIILIEIIVEILLCWRFCNKSISLQ